MLRINALNLYYGDAQALSNVSFYVEEGEIVAIVGANGAGKTSLIRTICGIHKPESGFVTFKGEDVTGLPSHKLCNMGIGHVAEGRQVFGSMTILENLEVGGLLAHSRSNIQKNLQKVFELFPRLQERQSQKASTLSGGEQQMLAIGRCLMGEPSIILFDEPSLGLSPVMVQEMFRIIHALHEQGMTIVLVEQNVVVSLEIANRAYVLENGTVTLSGTGKELLTHEGVRQAYLGI